MRRVYQFIHSRFGIDLLLLIEVFYLVKIEVYYYHHTTSIKVIIIVVVFFTTKNCFFTYGVRES